VVMVVLGGMGSITGSIVAATVLTVALEWMRGLDQYRMVIYSMLLIVLMLTRPGGLFGTREIWDRLPRWMGGSRAGGAAP
jgi:branched-chain amino acid transport system permease protein